MTERKRTGIFEFEAGETASEYEDALCEFSELLGIDEESDRVAIGSAINKLACEPDVLRNEVLNLQSELAEARALAECEKSTREELQEEYSSLEEAHKDVNDRWGIESAEQAEKLRIAVEALKEADRIMWMAEKYAESGGSNGPEARDIMGVPEKVSEALARIEKTEPAR